MRILLVTHRFPPEGTAGVERYTSALASELARRGHTVAVLTRRSEPGNPFIRIDRIEREDGVSLFVLAGQMHGLDRFLTQSGRVDLLFRRVLSEFGPELTHVNHLLFLSPGVLHLPHLFGSPVVLTLHDFYFACPLAHLQKVDGRLCAGPEGGRECAATCFAHEGEEGVLRWTMRNRFFRDLLEVPEIVLAPSAHVRDFFANEGGRSDIEVLGHGLPTAPGRARHTARSGPLRLACIGSLTPHKGVHQVVAALSQAMLKSCELRIIGEAHDPSYRQRIRAEGAKVPGLKLLFQGAYEPPRLPDVLSDVDFVIVPSVVPETFSLTAREALSCGIPIMVSALGALPEAVLEGVNGFTFRSPDELAALLQRVDAELPLRAALRNGAARTTIPLFQTHVDALEQKYGDAIARFRRYPGVRAARDRSVRKAQQGLSLLSEAPLS
jgi:glycosyltransferase involved in cell wall biosynthesis